ncbi:ATP-binding cassette domain-containing protein [Mycobacterium spongiae]|uniref:ABC-type quaternary amine transporter n=1 Tax=Mycobacterium spongiae TaxID=886343 RepID=A0A975K1U6_9MYCO|nr:ATP-binding cassette domain-containing protein [Mycobacterium spongiae]
MKAQQNTAAPQIKAPTGSVSLATTEPAISFSRVSVTYGKTTALRDFSLRVQPGETIAMLGPSGSGKSTALSALAGFVRPSSGRIQLFERDITNLPPARRGIGVVPQAYALFPHMKIEDNVAFGLRARRTPRTETAERVAECLELVGMSAYAKRLPRELSGGQQQRAAIARALAIAPKVLLLDEPLSALDAQLRAAMLVELAALKHRLPDTTMVYVTHDQTEALALADRIVLLRDAQLHALGTPEELWATPETQFTAQFLGGANLLRGIVKHLESDVAEVEVAPSVTLQAVATPAVGVGSIVDLAVRPHAATIHDLGDTDTHAARVTTAMWRGTSTRVTVALSDVPDSLLDVDILGRCEWAADHAVGIRFQTPSGVAIAVDGAP